MMIVNLQLQNVNISKFEIAVDFFKSTLVSASDYLLNKITQNINLQNEKLIKSYVYYKNNPQNLLSQDIQTIYDEIYEATEIYKVLLNEADEYKDKSVAFMKLYKALDMYYETLVVVPSDLGFIEANLMHKEDLIKNAS